MDLEDAGIHGNDTGPILDSDLGSCSLFIS
jgi:hypothetical protein